MQEATPTQIFANSELPSLVAALVHEIYQTSGVNLSVFAYNVIKLHNEQVRCEIEALQEEINALEQQLSEVLPADAQ